jgi:hypothetical protein
MNVSKPQSIDGALVRWGERLFYPGNRIVKVPPQPRLIATLAKRAALIRQRIEATAVRRAPQVMVKVTGGGRGMKAIAVHFLYISKNGRLDIEDEHGQISRGSQAVRELAEDWRFGGTLIDDIGDRREAFNIMLSMPRGTDPLTVQRAAREFAQAELADHKYVMVLHDHQANPHVHISVRAESKHGKRLNPRKADLHRWRETFAERLRGWGIDAEATRQASRGASRNFDPLWRVRAREDGRLKKARPGRKAGAAALASRSQAAEAWGHVAGALASSTDPKDRSVAGAIVRFVQDVSPERTGRADRPVNQQEVPTLQIRSGPKSYIEHQK